MEKRIHTFICDRLGCNRFLLKSCISLRTLLPEFQQEPGGLIKSLLFLNPYTEYCGINFKVLLVFKSLSGMESKHLSSLWYITLALLCDP